MAQPSPELRRQRQQLRAARLAVTGAQRTAAQRRIVRLVRSRLLVRPRMRLAVYLAARGEVDVGELVLHAWRVGAEVYVPEVTSLRRRRMRFVAYRPGAVLTRNRLGVLEPVAARQYRTPLGLDLVIVPMLGFDVRGRRLGMGAGYYDRAFAARRGDPRRAWRRPRLVGVAFACQQLARLDASPWDVAVDRIATERGWIVPRRDLPPSDSGAAP